MSSSSRLSPTWPTPRVRDASPQVVTLVALAHLAVTATANAGSSWGDEIGGWLLVTVTSAAVATVVWAALGVRIDAGRPGWKRVPRWVRIDPDSVPRRPLRWRWVLWYVPLWAVVTFGSLLLTPGTDDPVVELLLLTLVSGLVQVTGVLMTVIVVSLLVLPAVLLVVGGRRFGDGDGLPPTGPVLVATGVALLSTVPWAVAMTTLGTDAPWDAETGLWPAVAGVTTALLLGSLTLLVLYGLTVRDREARRVAPDG